MNNTLSLSLTVAVVRTTLEYKSSNRHRWVGGTGGKGQKRGQNGQDGQEGQEGQEGQSGLSVDIVASQQHFLISHDAARQRSVAR